MEIDKIQIADITLKEAIAKLEEIAASDIHFCDEVPEVLQMDFKKFLTGKGLSEINRRSVTHDFDMYMDKVINRNGFDYPIRWKI